MRSLAAQNGAKRAQNLRKKPGQEMAWFTTPEIDEDRGAVAKQTHQVRTCNSQPPTTSLTSFCLLYPHAGTTRSCAGSSCQEGEMRRTGRAVCPNQHGMDQLEVLAGP